jgi:tetratricopeptide (TPR) repeat protein
MQCVILGVVCALVVGIYAYTAHEGAYTQRIFDAASNYYNLLVQGFRAGQLNLKEEAPPILAQLADPYTFTPARPGSVLDLSYYKGKLYLYFGVTPAVLLFWPYVTLTGHYLFFKEAVVFFCVVGFLASAGLLRAICRRHFAEVSVGVVAAGTLALGLATFVPSLLARCDVYEVPISCGYALTMLALAAVWKALDAPPKRSGWLGAASLTYGLALGARPNLLFGAVILLAPVIEAWRERRRIWLPLVAATIPITLVGLGLMLYNLRRFDDPLEFGAHYQMTTRSLLHGQQLFGWRYLWLNLWAYILAPVRWHRQFPFGYGTVGGKDACGVLTNIPLTWLALAAPLAWRARTGTAGPVLQLFAIAVALLFGTCALTLGSYFVMSYRYVVDFLPALVLLAVVGIFGLERTFVCQPRHRMPARVVRWGWCLLLGLSVVFSLLTSMEVSAQADNDLGMQLQQAGRMQEAIRHYKQALRLNPDFADAHVNLGDALRKTGRIEEAIGQYEEAMRIKPDFPKAHFALGVAWLQVGRTQEALRQCEEALRLNPDFVEAHDNLGAALLMSGRKAEAIEQFEQSLHLNPERFEAHYNLGVALDEVGRTQEAIQQYQQALRIEPDFVPAQNALARARAVQSASTPTAEKSR